MNIDTVKRYLSNRTKTILVVHIFGIAADVGSICELNIPVIENICQAFGAIRNNKYVAHLALWQCAHFMEQNY
jgi:dTDP-4-amino-4,6-dideoxygalactose transaminase